MTDREKLIKLLDDGCRKAYDDITGKRTNEFVADYLLANGVIVTPCIAMVEQFIKDGKFDNKRTSHNGKYAVVYVDKSKWNCPLIDITEQQYNSEKALERIQIIIAKQTAQNGLAYATPNFELSEG